MMNDLEINGIAEGIAKYIMSKTESPVEGTAIIGITAVILYASSTTENFTIEAFAEHFKQGLIDTYKHRSDIGPGSLQ